MTGRSQGREQRDGEGVYQSACRITCILEKGCLYHFKVKPPHLARVLLALKDSNNQRDNRGVQENEYQGNVISSGPQFSS